jgi:hypothetical protein
VRRPSASRRARVAGKGAKAGERCARVALELKVQHARPGGFVDPCPQRVIGASAFGRCGQHGDLPDIVAQRGVQGIIRPAETALLGMDERQNAVARPRPLIVRPRVR